MADYGLSEQAVETYEDLSRDQTRWAALDAVEDAIFAIVDDPGSREVRGRRFQDPPCFVVPVHTPEGEWVVLWRLVDDDSEFEDLTAGDVFVIYFGPLPG